MPILKAVISSDLSKSYFERYPVWVFDDTNTKHHPLVAPSTDYRDYSPIFIKAEFLAPEGYGFSGYLIGCEASFYAFCLFVGKHDIIINRNIPCVTEIKEIQRYLEVTKLKLFPLKYSVKITNGENIEFCGEIT